MRYRECCLASLCLQRPLQDEVSTTYPVFLLKKLFCDLLNTLKSLQQQKMDEMVQQRGRTNYRFVLIGLYIVYLFQTLVLSDSILPKYLTT